MIQGRPDVVGRIACDEGNTLRHSSHALDSEKPRAYQRGTHHLDLVGVGIPGLRLYMAAKEASGGPRQGIWLARDGEIWGPMAPCGSLTSPGPSH